MMPMGKYTRQQAGIGNDVPRQGQRHVLVALQTVAIVPEVVLGVHVLKVQIGVLAPEDDLVPQDDLVQLVLLGLVLGRQVQEQLLHVPVEQTVQVGAEIEREEAEIVLLPGGAKVRNIFDQHFDGVDLGIGPVVVEEGRCEAAERQEGQDAQRIGEDCVPPGENGVHLELVVVRMLSGVDPN